MKLLLDENLSPTIAETLTDNFEKHRREAEERYQQIRPLHLDFCTTVGRLLNDISIAVLSIRLWRALRMLAVSESRL